MRFVFGRVEISAMLTWMVISSWCFAHPFHTTSAEMEFNPATRRFEVALKIFTPDFEHMIRNGQLPDANDKSCPDGTATQAEVTQRQREAQCAARYLAKRFMVTVDGKPCRLEWLGMEDEQASKWLYFELALPDEANTSGELTLTNKVLCDSNSGQINTVVFLSRRARVSLKTHEQQSKVALPSFE